MGNVERMQVVQPLQHVLKHRLDFRWRKAVVFVLDEFSQIAAHQIQAEVDDGRTVVGLGSLVDHFADVEDVGVVETLQQLDFSQSGDGEAHFAFVLDVLHLLECVVVIVEQIACTVD